MTLETFIEQHKLQQGIKLSKHLIQRHFGDVDITLELVIVPFVCDQEETYISMKFIVEGEVNEIIKLHDAYIDDWLRLFTPNERNKIILGYNVK